MRKIIAVLILIALMLSGCAAQQQSSTLFAMDTVMELKIYGNKSILSGAEDLIKSLESILSVTDERSEIYLLNHGQSTEVSSETMEIITSALKECENTEGALDISIYPVLRKWGFTTGDYRVPDAGEIEELLQYVDYSSITIDGNNVEFPEGMEIDLGSVAKGYTGDRVIDYLRKNGVKSACISLGGNVQTLGSKPDGSKWRVGIKSPTGNGTVGVVDIADKAVITSGGYERYFEDNGKTYWHILDPKTGFPADNGLVSVTIIGDCGLRCDALSTALFVMGLDKASDYWNMNDDFEAVFITSTGSIIITDGLENCFTASNSQHAEVLRHAEN